MTTRGVELVVRGMGRSRVGGVGWKGTRGVVVSDVGARVQSQWVDPSGCQVFKSFEDKMTG
jgi:hypothetical protein